MLKKTHPILSLNICLVILFVLFLHVECNGKYEQYSTNQEEIPSKTTNTAKKLNYSKPRQGKKKPNSNQTTNKRVASNSGYIYVPKKDLNAISSINISQTTSLSNAELKSDQASEKLKASNSTDLYAPKKAMNTPSPRANSQPVALPKGQPKPNKATNKEKFAKPKYIYVAKQNASAPSPKSISQTDSVSDVKLKSNQTSEKLEASNSTDLYVPKKDADAPSLKAISQPVLFAKEKSKAPKKYKKKALLPQDKFKSPKQIHVPSNSSPEFNFSPNASAEQLESLRTKVIDLEKAEEFLEAALMMDQLLAIVGTPTLEDLFYALDLHQKAPDIMQKRDRQHQLATLIARHVQINPKKPNINFQQFYWHQIRPYLDYLIAETILDPRYEEKTFYYTLKGQYINEHWKWLLHTIRTNNYPISIGGGNNSTEGSKSDQGVWDIYHNEITITNDTQKEIEARELFAYQFHGGKLDPTCINPITFYNLMVRAGFEKEDFKQGKYGFQDKIFVKHILLNKPTIEECEEELRTNVSTILRKAKQPYVTFIFELQPNTPFRLYDVYTHNDNTPKDLWRYFHEELGGPAATITEELEKRLYLCFYNIKQNMLDLHGASVDEAFDKLSSFILERYDNFEDECTVITGRGNHINPNGEAGILHNSFKKWVKRELKPYIKTYIPSKGDGGYKVILRKPVKVVLSNQSFELNLQQATTSFLQANQTNNKRLVITHQQLQPDIYYYKLVIALLNELADKHAIYVEFQEKTIENGIQLSWG